MWHRIQARRWSGCLLIRRREGVAIRPCRHVAPCMPAVVIVAARHDLTSHPDSGAVCPPPVAIEQAPTSQQRRSVHEHTTLRIATFVLVLAISTLSCPFSLSRVPPAARSASILNWGENLGFITSTSPDRPIRNPWEVNPGALIRAIEQRPNGHYEPFRRVRGYLKLRLRVFPIARC